MHVGALHVPLPDELVEPDELDEELDEVFPSSPAASSPVSSPTSSPASSPTPLLLLGSPLLLPVPEPLPLELLLPLVPLLLPPEVLDEFARPPSRGDSPGPLVAHENTNPVVSNTIPPAVRRPPKRMG